MASNILEMIHQFKGSKIVVLSGFFHRYYLQSELKPNQKKQGFVIKEFYDYY